MELIYSEIGRRIRRERETLGFSQTDVATFVGLKRPISISEYEDGKVRIPIHILYRVAEALGVSVACLLPTMPEE